MILTKESKKTVQITMNKAAKAVGLSKAEMNTLRLKGIHFMEKIGQGTFAKVVLVEYQESSDLKPQTLACKIFDKKKVPEEYLNDFFYRELKILTRLNHPHIVQVHSILKHGFKLYIFMRYAENGDLMKYLDENGPVPEDKAKLWFTQVALGLQYLHDRDIAHRDLKCENILLTKNYNALLTDFGFSRYIADDEVTQTFCGSQAYVAPDILSEQPHHPKRCDVWSLGIILYVMLSSSFPFNSHSVSKQLQKQLNQDWEFSPKNFNDTSYEARDMVVYILNPDSNKRPTISRVLCHIWVNSN